MNQREHTPQPAGREAGFTLIEAMTAIVILAFGLVAVTNLLVVAASSNVNASQTTASAALCSQQMDQLKATPFDTLTSGCSSSCGGITSNVTGYNTTQTVQGVGNFTIRWQITPVGGQAQLYFLQVRCQATSGIMSARTRTDLTSFRSCTDSTLGCPAAP